MNTITRRAALQGSLAGGLTLALPYSRAIGANNDIRVAVVGLHNQGSNHVKWFRKIPGVRVVALCDADRAVLDREAAKFAARKETVAAYRDYRRLLEDKDIDAVITATPNHWHALVTVWGCRAGKDVYVEKPVSHTIWEGRQMVKAARAHGRIVQSGTQRRSDTGLKEAIAWLREGHLGKITLVRGTRAGFVVHCEGGHFVGGWAYDTDGKKVKQFKCTGGRGHHANFIEAVRSRKSADLNAEVLEGHLSSALCHMGNISHRLGRDAPPDAVRESLAGSAGMREAFGRMHEHLLANGVDLEATPYTLGPALALDPATEAFTGPLAEQANRLCTRAYRAPFVVPEIAG